ncbi:hypothetical protein ACWCV5_31240 [Streptomyces tubercidicus]
MTHQPPQMPPAGSGAPLPPYPGAPVPPQNGSTPSAGFPHQGGGGSFVPQPPPLPPQRSRTGLILTVVLVVVVLLVGGGFLAFSMLGGGDEDTEAKQGQGQSQGSGQDQGKEGATAAVPKVVKSTAGELRYDAQATADLYPPEKRNPASYPELKGLAQVDSVYYPQDNRSVNLAVHTGSGTVSDPAQRVAAAFAPNAMAGKPKDFDLQDPTAKGAVLRCGISKGKGEYIPLCVWADRTSVGDVLGLGEATSPSLKKVDLKTLAQQTVDLRKAMRGGSGG